MACMEESGSCRLDLVKLTSTDQGHYDLRRLKVLQKKQNLTQTPLANSFHSKQFLLHFSMKDKVL